MPSLSQEYRPQRFADVTGQEHISDTLRKEIATGKLGHAYLFSGPRGVGKTTSARIFAKALNCLAPQDGEPCTTCALCVAFQEGRLVDVIELDAATHTGVDTVRESIIEHARFAPMMGKRKVYILDEAHMLSTASWNALLKTLEEPPAHAFFLLATTEVHKVPATIVSRCQRFEFRRIADAPLAARLNHIATEQKWQVDEEVIRLLVARAEGCARDAETLLGQLGALGETHLTLALASLVIPPSRIPLAAELMGTWAKRDHVSALQTGQRFFDQGVPLVPLMDDLLLVVKRLLFAIADPNTAETWKQGTEEDRCLLPLLSVFSPLELNEMALMLMERRRDMKGGVDPLFALQLASTVIAFRGQSIAVAPASITPIAPQPAITPRVQEVVVLKQEAPIAPVSISTPSVSAVVSAPTPSMAEVTSPVLEQSLTESTHSESIATSVMPSEGPAPALDVQLIRAKWNAVIRIVEEINHSLPFILKISRPEYVQGDTVVIRFQYTFHRDKVLNDAKNRRVVEDVMREMFQVPTLRLEGIIGEEEGSVEQRSQDVVTNVLKDFGGSVVEQ